MQTVIVLVIKHDRPILDLPELVAQRAWTIDGVSSADVLTEDSPWPDLHPPEVLDTVIPTRTPSDAGDSQWSWTGNAPL